MCEFIDEIRDRLDDEMWYSITPHEIAKSHASALTMTGDIHLILDAFCGIGGDCIYIPASIFAVGTDIVQARLELAKELTTRHGKARCDFVLADSVKGKSCFRTKSFDCVYLSPPWGHDGARNRKKAPVFGQRSLESLCVDGNKAFMRALSLVRRENIAFFLPRGIREDQLNELCVRYTRTMSLLIVIHESFDPDDETVMERDKFRVRALTVYFGDLASQDTLT